MQAGDQIVILQNAPVSAEPVRAGDVGTVLKVHGNDKGFTYTVASSSVYWQMSGGQEGILWNPAKTVKPEPLKAGDMIEFLEERHMGARHVQKGDVCEVYAVNGNTIFYHHSKGNKYAWGLGYYTEKFKEGTGWKRASSATAEAAAEATGDTDVEPQGEGRVMTTKKNRFDTTEVGLLRDGRQIVLPAEPFPMTLDEGIETLNRIKKENETLLSVNEVVEAFPYDGAYAFMNVLKERYGWATPVPTPSFFGDVPPETVSLEIAPEVFTQVIWGRFKVPNIEGALSTGATRKDGRWVFCIQGEIKKKHQAEIKAIADDVRAYVKEHSVYKGKVISIKVGDDGHLDQKSPPKFLNVSGVNEEELTFSENVMAQINTNLFTPIEKTALCLANKVPLKRGVLLAGRYGTGKTLTAFVAAKKCQANGWTFILLDKVGGLKEALLFAQMYQPAVVFSEDIDRVVTGERSEEMDDILNTIDGVVSKSAKILTVLTTNHVENINKAMLRPGRLDAVITVAPPDAAAVQKLIRIYARDLVPASVDLSEAGKELEGQIPAVIREVVERAKLYAISHLASGQVLELTGKDLAHSARGMKEHLGLMETPKPEEGRTVEFRVGNAIVEAVKLGMQPVSKQVAEVRECL